MTGSQSFYLQKVGAPITQPNFSLLMKPSSNTLSMTIRMNRYATYLPGTGTMLLQGNEAQH